MKKKLAALCCLLSFCVTHPLTAQGYRAPSHPSSQQPKPCGPCLPTPASPYTETTMPCIPPCAPECGKKSALCLYDPVVVAAIGAAIATIVVLISNPNHDHAHIQAHAH